MYNINVIKTYACVIGVVKYNDKILLLKRASTRKTSADKWQPPSGYIKEREAAEDAVVREVKEETGLDGKIEKIGNIFDVTDKWGRWVIMPFLITVKSDKVKIDPREHSNIVWVKPKEIEEFDLVAGVKQDIKAVGFL